MAERKRISYEDRQAIERMVKDGKGVTYIARCLNKSRNTIYYELGRCDGIYNAHDAQLTYGRS